MPQAGDLRTSSQNRDMQKTYPSRPPGNPQKSATPTPINFLGVKLEIRLCQGSRAEVSECKRMRPISGALPIH